MRQAIGVTDVATSEVTALEHELGDDAVEGRALVAEALLTGAESTEVLGGLGHDAVVELEVDAAGLDYTARNDVSSASVRSLGTMIDEEKNCCVVYLDDEG